MTETLYRKKQNFRETWINISDTGSLYICLTRQLFVTEEDVEAMMEYVNAGNSLFISAALIDRQLLDELGCSAAYISPYMEDVAGLCNPHTLNRCINPKQKYDYFYYPFRNYFTDIDSANTRILGYNDAGKPNSIVHFYGRGKLYQVLN